MKEACNGLKATSFLDKAVAVIRTRRGNFKKEVHVGSKIHTYDGTLRVLEIQKYGWDILYWCKVGGRMIPFIEDEMM
jgi:hypothetical protein